MKNNFWNIIGLVMIALVSWYFSSMNTSVKELAITSAKHDTEIAVLNAKFDDISKRLDEILIKLDKLRR